MAECSAALEGQPAFFKALVRRAKAYEQMGQPKQALADLQRANKLDAATADTRVGAEAAAPCAACARRQPRAACRCRRAAAMAVQESERRLRDVVAGKKPAGMGNGLATKKASAVPSKATGSGRQVVFPAKLSLGDDTRLVQVRGGGRRAAQRAMLAPRCRAAAAAARCVPCQPSLTALPCTRPRLPSCCPAAGARGHLP